MTNVTVLLAGTKTEFAMSRESSVLELHEKVVEHGKTINVLPSGHQILLYREADILDFHENVFSPRHFHILYLIFVFDEVFNCSDYLHCNFDKARLMGPSKLSQSCSRICNESDHWHHF